MLHFPSSLSLQTSASTSRGADTLNATQQKSDSNPFFLTVEEELHDARRVLSHGQEEDLRFALNMIIPRLTELSLLLSEAYKTQADLEVQLNVAKSNLQLVISNNEMLEEVLKRDTEQSKNVGWRRTSGRDDSRDRTTSLDIKLSDGHPPKKELEDLTEQLDKERLARKAATDDKIRMESELESLTQELFEQANEMVASERMKLADTEEELKEVRLEKEALLSALRLMEGENSNTNTQYPIPNNHGGNSTSHLT